MKCKKMVLDVFNDNFETYTRYYGVKRVIAFLISLNGTFWKKVWETQFYSKLIINLVTFKTTFKRLKKSIIIVSFAKQYKKI